MSEILTVHFDGEAPKIGSGRREIDLLSLGPKWATIRRASGGRKVRLRRSTWNAIMNANCNRKDKP